MGATAVNLSALESFARGLDEHSERPNILCIVGEGLRADEFSAAGNRILQTPHMDRIATEGCTFHNAFV